MFARRGADGDVCATAKRPSTDASSVPSKKGGLHAIMRAAVFRWYAMAPPHGRAENAPLLPVGSSIPPPILTAFDPFHACVSPSMWVCLSQTARSVFGCPQRIRGKERSELFLLKFFFSGYTHRRRHRMRIFRMEMTHDSIVSLDELTLELWQFLLRRSPKMLPAATLKSKAA